MAEQALGRYRPSLRSGRTFKGTLAEEMMKEFTVTHPAMAIGIAAVPVIVALLLIWRGRLAVRMVATLAGLAWTVVATTYLAFMVAEASSFIDRKNFIFLPVESILHDITTTSAEGDLEATRLKLKEFQSNWNTICMTTNDPWAIQARIEAIGNKADANHTSEGIRRPADGSPKPSM